MLCKASFDVSGQKELRKIYFFLLRKQVHRQKAEDHVGG